MILSIDLNFGKHVERTFVFEPGVNILRGANESGKSTIINAIAYNWFGTGILTYELEHYVPEGAKKTALKTRTVFLAQDEEYICIRGASGAELRQGDKVLATNHAAVTAKVEELLGVPAGKAGDTMYAAQGGIRGVLELGPTQVAGFIERVAGFEQVDQLLHELGEKLVTGPTKGYEEQLTVKKEQLKEAELAVQFGTSFSQLEGELLSLKSDLAEVQQVIAEAKAEIKTVAERRQERERAVVRLGKELAEANRLQALRITLEQDVAAARGAEERIAVVTAQVQQHNTWQVYQDFLKLPQTEEVWDGNEASLAAEIQKLQAEQGEVQVETSRLREARRSVAARRLTSTVCPITKRECNELTDKALIERTNQEIDQQLKGIEDQIGACQIRLQEAQAEAAVLTELSAGQARIKQWLASFADYVVTDETQVPWGVLWRGPEPAAVPMPAGDLFGLQQRIAAAERAQAQLQVLPLVRATATIQAEIDALPLAPALDTLQSRLDEVEEHRRELEAAIKDNEDSQFHMSQAERSRQETRARLEQEIETLKQQIEQIREDNNLVKAVKAARLQVSEMLWRKVLTGVSVYFSRMRGVESIVERTARGFVVNGTRAVSGSTYDILALALRITILKLFSQCPLMIIDEGNSGSDQNRSAAMVGVLGSCGLNQVLFVTHKDADEAAGVNLIEL